MKYKPYDPKKNTLIIGAQIISGYGDGTYVKVSRNQDFVTLKMGTDGEGTRSISNDKSGRFEITLMQSTPSNDYLSSLAATDELSGTGLVPILFRDASGTSIASCVNAWIVKLPDLEQQKEVNTRTWIFETDVLELFVGGQLSA